MMGGDAAILLLRVALGAIYVAHGLRKLGWHNPDGLPGFRASIARRGFRPPVAWAAAAIVCEVGGGILLIMGLATPVAAALLLAQSVTIVALVRGRGFWVEAMGVEYPLLLGVAAAAVGLAGPGAWSLDASLGLWLPPWAFPVLAAGTVTASIVGLVMRRPVPAARS